MESSKIYENLMHADVVAAAVLLDQPSLLLMIAQSQTYAMSPAYRKIGEALAFDVFKLLEWQKAVATAAPKTLKTSQIWTALCLILEGSKNTLGSSRNVMTSCTDSWLDWMYLTITITASREVSLPMDTVDSGTHVQIAREHPHGEQYLFHIVLPYVKKNIANIGSPLYFLDAIFSSYNVNSIRKEVAKNLYRDVLGDLIPEWFKV